VVICLERGADLHMAQLMPLALAVSCFSKIQIGFTFLVPAHLGSPGCVCACVCVCCDCTNPATGRQISADSSCLVGATVSRRHGYGQIGAGYDVRCFTAPHTAAGYLPTAPLSRVAPYFTAAISHADAFHSNQHSVAGADSLQYSMLRA